MPASWNIDRPVSPWSTKRLNPTGGVIWLISTTSTRKMPNQMGSMPAASTMGSTIETVRTTIEIPSRNMPMTMKKSVRTASSASGESPISAMPRAMARGMPVKPMATVRNAAPARMKAIMAVVTVAAESVSEKARAVIPPPRAARTSAPRTPMTAASVGEAIPR